MSSSSSSDPVCTRCKTTSSLIWQRDQNGAVICLECHSTEKAKAATKIPEHPTVKHMRTSPTEGSGKHMRTSPTEGSGKHMKTSPTEGSGKHMKTSPTEGSGKHMKTSSKQSASSTEHSVSGVTTRRTTRSHERAKAKQQQEQEESVTAKSEGSNSFVEECENEETTQSKEKCDGGGISKKSEATGLGVNNEPNSPATSTRSRRNLRQGYPIQAPPSQPYLLACSSIEYQGTHFEVGDVVSLLGTDGGVYYAISRGFLCDGYANKFIVLTWLLPRYPNPTHFDPALFILGPEEDVPRSMNHVDFVCHSPQSRHFQNSYFHNMEQAELWLSALNEPLQ